METTMKSWYYKGPAYRFTQYLGEVGPIYTTAPTRGKAKTNILHKLRKQLGLVKSAKLVIDDVLILPFTPKKRETNFELEFEIQYCDKCGTQLNDSGECPKCDLGEEDL